MILRLCSLLLVSGWALCSPAQQPADAHDRAQQAFESVLRAYEPATGRFKGQGWWNDANSVTVTAEWALVSPPASRAVEVLANTFQNAPHAAVAGESGAPGFLNQFYDDEGWWALAWIDAYDATHRPEYLAMAQSIFTDMQGGWDNTCGGGLWWSKERTYKNAIPNELFLSVAARLAQRAEGPVRARSLEWARREWAWFQASGMINSEGLINDGLTPACRNNGRQTWTYNQGVILGGLVALADVDHRPALMRRASSIAHAALGHLTDRAGVLFEPGGAGCGPDAVSFKGIFVRNLTTLAKQAPDPAYTRFMKRNAAAVWAEAQAADGGFACSWSGPARNDGVAATTSAMAPLLGLLALQPDRK